MIGGGIAHAASGLAPAALSFQWGRSGSTWGLRGNPARHFTLINTLTVSYENSGGRGRPTPGRVLFIPFSALQLRGIRFSGPRKDVRRNAEGTEEGESSNPLYKRLYLPITGKERDDSDGSAWTESGVWDRLGGATTEPVDGPGDAGPGRSDGTPPGQGNDRNTFLTSHACSESGSRVVRPPGTRAPERTAGPAFFYPPARLRASPGTAPAPSR